MPELKAEKAFILSRKRLGEKSVIVSVLTEEHGRLKGVYNHKKPPEVGIWVSARWQARLSEQLGTFYLEELNPVSVAYLDDPKRLSVILSVCALLDELLPERQAYPALFYQVEELLAALEGNEFEKEYALFEKELLADIGFGLDMSCCAGGGDGNNLGYISPKTGRAVSFEKGEPYKNKLFPLPAFLWKEASATQSDIQQALKITGYFLAQHTRYNRLPQARACLIQD